MGTTRSVASEGIAFQKFAGLNDLVLALSLAWEDYRLATLFGGHVPYQPENTVEVVAARIEDLRARIALLEETIAREKKNQAA